jgi:hypothetical protein
MDWEQETADDRNTSPEPGAFKDVVSSDDDGGGEAVSTRQTRSRARSGCNSRAGSKRPRGEDAQRVATRSAGTAASRGAPPERQGGTHIRIKRRVQR